MTKLAIINPGGVTNFGERAIMLGTLYRLREQFPDAEIAIFGYETLETDDPDLYRELDTFGVRYFPSISYGSKLTKALRAAGMWLAPSLVWPKESYEYLKDAIVYSKGQETLTENYGFVHFIDSVLEQLLVSRFNKNVILYGQSIGPVAKYTGLAKWILKHFAKIYVRDSKSLEVTKQLGYPESQTEQIKDLAYTAVDRYDLKTSFQPDSHYLIIPNAAICTTPENEAAYVANLRSVIELLLGSGKKVVISSSVTDKGWNNDYRLCEQLADEYGGLELRHYKELRDLLIDIKNAKRVISSRLHPLIMATGLDINVFALSRSHKVLGLLGDLNLSEYIVDPYQPLNQDDARKAL